MYGLEPTEASDPASAPVSTGASGFHDWLERISFGQIDMEFMPYVVTVSLVSVFFSFWINHRFLGKPFIFVVAAVSFIPAFLSALFGILVLSFLLSYLIDIRIAVVALAGGLFTFTPLSLAFSALIGAPITYLFLCMTGFFSRFLRSEKNG